MSFKHKENEGSFFKNDYKEKDNQPDSTGTCNINGEDMTIAVWHNEAKEGKKENYFFRISKPRVKEDSNTTSTPAPEFEGIPS